MPTTTSRQVWTVADPEAIDDPDWRRYEIVDGALVVGPRLRPGTTSWCARRSVLRSGSCCR